MKFIFYDIMRLFQDVCMVLSLLFSLRLINNPKVIRYMRHFYWYSIVGGAMVLLTWANKLLAFPANGVLMQIRNYSILFHFGFLSFFIFSVLPNNKKFKFSLPLLLGIFCLTLFYCAKYKGKTLNSASYSLANLSLVFFCIIYYHQLFKNNLKLSLLEEPSFWVITGIFLCMSIVIPIHALQQYLKNQNYVKVENSKTILSIAYFIYGMFHLFLIKAYLCSISTEKVKIPV